MFSKLLKAVSIAARREANPDFNPRLRAAITKAKENNVPNDNIERAINKAGDDKELEEITVEAYGPEKVAIIIEAITDNTNRTIAELRHLLDKNDAKMAERGSVLWSFDKQTDTENNEWQAKFKQAVSEDAKNKINSLIEKLDEHDDVQKIITNMQS